MIKAVVVCKKTSPKEYEVVFTADKSDCKEIEPALPYATTDDAVDYVRQAFEVNGYKLRNANNTREATAKFLLGTFNEMYIDYTFVDLAEPNKPITHAEGTFDTSIEHPTSDLEEQGVKLMKVRNLIQPSLVTIINKNVEAQKAFNNAAELLNNLIKAVNPLLAQAKQKDDAISEFAKNWNRAVKEACKSFDETLGEVRSSFDNYFNQFILMNLETQKQMMLRRKQQEQEQRQNLERLNEEQKEQREKDELNRKIEAEAVNKRIASLEAKIKALQAEHKRNTYKIGILDSIIAKTGKVLSYAKSVGSKVKQRLETLIHISRRHDNDNDNDIGGPGL